MPILQDKVVLVTGAGLGSGAPRRWRWPKPAPTWRLPTSTSPPRSAQPARRPAMRGGRSPSGPIAAMSRASTQWSRAPLPSSAGSTSSSTMPGHALCADHGPDRGRLGPHPPGHAKGVFFCLQRAAREMISQGGGGGRIINIASISARGIRAVRAGHDPAGLCRDAGVVIPTYCNDTVVRIPPDGSGNGPSAHAPNRAAARGWLPQQSAALLTSVVRMSA
jgi:hypothetical protein